jgi:cation diffusion facilitator CzcD-associated flavoprotein CzcO
VTPTATHSRVAIVGTGFSGLAAAVRLRQAGEDDVVLYERASDVGGTWRDNSYPGCACDVPSHLYSLSFAPNPGWSRAFSPQPEIHRYLQDVARDHGVLPQIRFDHALVEAAWDDAAQRWTLETAQGTYTADVLISAVGGLSEPAVPALPGLDRFAGPAFHSARWDHDVDLTGKRVAVVGTGASAIQFVPEIQPHVERLTVLQRTPPWILPRRDRALAGWEHRLFRAVPAAQRAVRGAIHWGRELFALPLVKPRLGGRTEALGRAHIARSVADPELRAKLTPDYAIGCKRILLSNTYLPALTKENVDVVTSGIREVREDAIVTEDGTVVPADVIVFGTGFRVTDMPIGHQVRGRDGRTLHQTWRGSPSAHLGTTVAGFPNLFLLMGPNTGLGHTSVTLMIEAQVGYVVQALAQLDGDVRAIEPTPAAQAAWDADVDRRSAGTAWTAGGCASWYLDEHGRNSTLWPTFVTAYQRRLARFDPGEHAYTLRRPAPVREPVAV